MEMEKNMDNNIKFLERPVFISGYNKSGTTLLLSLLDNHPELVVFPEELHFFKKEVLFNKNKYKAITEHTGAKLLLSDDYLKEWTKGKSWFKEGYPEFDNKKLDKLLKDNINTHLKTKDILISIIYSYSVADGINFKNKKYWVSKTTQEEMFFPLLVKMFNKNIKFYYVVRDPRDVYVSFKERQNVRDEQLSKSKENLERFIFDWKVRVNKACYYEKCYKNFYIIKYEDLLYKPEATLKRINDGLEIDYTDSLLQPTRHGKSWGGNSVYSKEFNGITTETIGRFQKFLTKDEILFVQKLLQKELKYFNYSFFKTTSSNYKYYSVINFVRYFKVKIIYYLKQKYFLYRYLFL